MATAFTDPSAQLDFPAFRPEMAYPPLTDDMIEIIRAYASDFTVSAGTTIFARGERGTDMFVVLEGNVNIYTGGEENTSETVIDLGDHQFTGELNMLNDQPTLVAARTTVPSLLLRVTRGDLRRLMRAEGEIANLILQAFCSGCEPGSARSALRYSWPNPAPRASTPLSISGNSASAPRPYPKPLDN